LPERLNPTSLRFLLTETGQPGSEGVVVLPVPPGSGAEAIAQSLIASVAEGLWRLVPAPNLGTDVIAQRAWHRDLWFAMASADRDSVAAVIGGTAGYLAPVLADSARTVVFVREPLAAIGLVGDAMPKRRALERLKATAAGEAPQRLLRVANPQSRALLAPWHDPSELMVSPGPPTDAERWREALFGDVLPNLDAWAIEQAPDVARELARLLGGRPKAVAQATKTAADGAAHGLEDSAHAELLLRLNWLDAELHERCLGTNSQPG
jgi:hypothetical protein